MTEITSRDLLALLTQAQHAGDFFAEMISEEGGRDSYKVTTHEVGEMLDGHPLYLADDRAEVDFRRVPPVVREAMKYVCWKAVREGLAERSTPPGGKQRKRRGGGLVAAAQALKGVWR